VQTALTAIQAKANEVWSGIEKWALDSYKKIAAAYESGGIDKALEVTWQQVKTGATDAWNWIKNQITSIDWSAVGTKLNTIWQDIKTAGFNAYTWIKDQVKQINWAEVGKAANNAWQFVKTEGQNAFKFIFDEALKVDWVKVGETIAYWVVYAVKQAADFTDWLKTLDWEGVGTKIGETIGNLMATAFTGAGGEPGWLVQIGQALLRIADHGFEIGTKLIEGIVKGMAAKYPLIAQLLGIGDTIAEGLNQTTNAIQGAGKGLNSLFVEAGKGVESLTGWDPFGFQQAPETAPLVTRPLLPQAPQAEPVAAISGPGLLQQSAANQNLQVTANQRFTFAFTGLPEGVTATATAAPTTQSGSDVIQFTKPDVGLSGTRMPATATG
jgi:hypothetical protein